MRQVRRGRLETTIQVHAPDLRHALVDILDVEAVSIGCPRNVRERTIQRFAHDPMIAAVDVHQVQTKVLVADVLVGEAYVRDELASGESLGVW